MANEPKINLALVGEMPENPVRGTVYMSPDASGNFVKVGVDGSVRTIFDGSDYVRKDESVWIPGYGGNSAVLANGYSYATGNESVSHGSVTYAKGLNSHAEGAGCADYSISVYSNFSNNMIYGAVNLDILNISSYVGLLVSYEDVYAMIIDAYFNKRLGAVFVLDKPLLDDGSDFREKTEVHLLSGGVAAGEGSHTEGDSTVAVGRFSHAEGITTYAGSRNSHAEGSGTLAMGSFSHAEGSDTLVTGSSSHAEGTTTTASGDNSHAEGITTIAFGDNSHAEGEGQEISITINGSAGATHYRVTGGPISDVKVGDIIRYRRDMIKMTTLPYEKVNPDNGFAYAIITEVRTGKIRYIEVDNTLSFLSDITDGTGHILQGVAKGISSHSEGYYTNAVSNYSHSEGTGTRALGEYSHVEGDTTMTLGSSSHAEGCSTIASGDNSHAEGNGTTTLGDNSHAEGNGTTTLGDNSHAEGTETATFGSGSHAEGEGARIPLAGIEVYGQQNATVYTTSSAHELSVNDIIYVDYGTDEFVNKIAKVVSVDTSTQFTVDDTLNPDVPLDASLAGTYTFYRLLGCTYGASSHVEGINTTALGDYSHAEGVNTTALGDYSHAEGMYTRTNNAYEHAQGSYNMSHNYNATFGNSGNTLNSIGVGVSDASRLNAIEVMQNGDVYVKGVGLYDGSNYVNASTLQEVINDGGGGSAEYMTNVTYSELKALCDSSSLVPGMQYRITDYKCTTTQADTSAQSNCFDIIVVADSESTLNENARAAYHINSTSITINPGTNSFTYPSWMPQQSVSDALSGFSPSDNDEIKFGGNIDIYNSTYGWGGDLTSLAPGSNYTYISSSTTAKTLTFENIDPYFANCNLKAWELKYCLDNDTDRFAWADSSNGKGVIYYMKDEWSNECPYDFKNIQFKRWAITMDQDHPSLVVDSQDNNYGFYYGAMQLNGESQVLENATYGNDFGWFYTFALKDLATEDWYDYTVVAHLGLKNNEGNDIVCYDNHLEPATDEYSSGKGEMAKMLNNIVFFNCYTDLSDTSYADDYSYCSNNRFQGNCSSNTFGIGCGGNTFGNYFQSNTFGSYCQSNTFRNICGGNTFGNSCCNNTFGNDCGGNTFGNYCQQLTVFNSVKYCSVTGGSQNSKVKNAQILNGTAGASLSNKLTITFEANKSYTQIAGKNTSGILKIWNPADLIN